MEKRKEEEEKLTQRRGGRGEDAEKSSPQRSAENAEKKCKSVGV